MRSLKERRIIQIKKISIKCYKNKRFKDGFCKQSEPMQQFVRTPRNATKPAPILKTVTCRTQRYARLSLSVMTSLLSWHPPLRYTSLDLTLASSVYNCRRLIILDYCWCQYCAIFSSACTGEQYLRLPPNIEIYLAYNMIIYGFHGW